MIKPCIAHGITGNMQFRISNANNLEEYQAALNETYFSPRDVQEAIITARKSIGTPAFYDETNGSLDDAAKYVLELMETELGIDNKYPGQIKIDNLLTERYAVCKCCSQRAYKIGTDGNNCVRCITGHHVEEEEEK